MLIKLNLYNFVLNLQKDTFNISVDGHPISRIDNVLDLGVILDSHLNMEKHVSKLCSSASISLKRISSLRKYLSKDILERLVDAFISTKMGYCNSILYGLSDYNIK